MALSPGIYRYALRQSGAVVAHEESRVTDNAIIASRRSIDGFTRYEVDAAIDEQGRISRISLRYSSSMFRRDASYRADGESFRGNVSAMAGRNEIVIKLGRFGEIEAAGMTIFRALIVAHVIERGQSRWTGRVAVIDPATLAAASIKQTCRVGRGPRTWIYEARMGDSETIGLDENGRIERRRDERGGEVELVGFDPI